MDLESKIQAGRAGEALLQWLENLDPGHVSQMLVRVTRRCGTSGTDLVCPERQREPEVGLLRTRTGLVYR